MGSSPYWCWGHEEGINEAVVAIGNEAQFTRDFMRAAADDRAGNGPTPGLVGMELLRLGLERGATAERAVDVITQRIVRHGQYSSGGVGKAACHGGYDNSFFITDPHEMWVLETSGRHWAARRVTEASASISNEPTIRTEWTRASEGLVEHMREVGAPVTEPDYAQALVDPATPYQLSHLRLMRSRQLLREAIDVGPVSWRQARAVLADHYEGTFIDGPASMLLARTSCPCACTWARDASPGATPPLRCWRSPILDGPTGDELGTMYAERQPVREVLDSLQAGWLEEVDILLADGAGASAWDDLTARATEQAMAAATDLLSRFA